MKKILVAVCMFTVINCFAKNVDCIIHHNIEGKEDIKMSIYVDDIRVMIENSEVVSKSIESIDVRFIDPKEVTFTEDSIGTTPIYVRLYVEDRFCDLLYWIKSRSGREITPELLQEEWGENHKIYPEHKTLNASIQNSIQKGYNDYEYASWGKKNNPNANYKRYYKKS